MTVVYRADADVTNGTAGTSAVVSRPTGTTDGDLLIAIVGVVGTPTITAPAGWTLIGTQDASTSVRIAAYRKVASSEPSSWTWTLDSSQRAWGWVGAYTGVDVTDPVIDWAGTSDATAGIAFLGPEADISIGAVGIGAIASVGAASGVASTWTMSDTERADLGTNGGSGTDVSGSVVETTHTDVDPTEYGPLWTASQSQTAGAMLAITLRSTLVAFDGGPPEPTVEIAWGADPDGDPDDWDWTDITNDVRIESGIVIVKGLQPNSQAALAPPTSVTLTLDNPAGDYTPDNPLGANWPHVVADTPLRVTVPYGYAPPTDRATVLIESWTPGWDASTNDSVVAIQAYGRLQQIQAPLTPPLWSPLRRALMGQTVVSEVAPTAYWSGEDGSGATTAASALPGQPPMMTIGTVTFGADATCLGSAPLPTLASGASLRGKPPPADPGQWCALVVVRVPSAPASAATLMRTTCTGTAWAWQIEVEPSTPDNMYIRAYDADGTEILEDGWSITESEVYGQWVMLMIGVTQDGSDVNYNAQYLTASGGSGVLGTLASHTCGYNTEIRVTAESTTDGMGVGHLTLFADPGFDQSSDPLELAIIGLGARAGDPPYIRFADLLTEARIPYHLTATRNRPPLLGPQTISSLATALEECAATDQGLIHDGGPGGAVSMVTRWSMLNQRVALTIDSDSAELATPFAPTFSSRDRISDSTVTRDGGSSGRYVNRSVRGRPESVTLSLDSDAYLEQIAAHRVNTSTVPGMRYPALSINLRRTPDLVADWLGCRIGSRTQATNLWQSHGPAVVDQLMLGYVERISTGWDVSLHCYPAEPYTVGVVEDPVLGRADTDGSVLAGTVTGLTASGPLISDGFEVDTSGWFANTGGSVARSTAQAHEGFASLLFTPDGVTATGEARSANAAGVVAGQTYRASAWVRCAAARSVNANIVWRDASGSFLGNAGSVSVNVVADTWTPIEVVGVAPASAAQAQISINMGSTPPAGHLLYIDEATLTLAVRALVVVTAGPPWIASSTHASMFPFDVRTSGVVLSVTGIATVAVDTFTRSVGAGGWGTATTGQAWSVNSGVAANWSVTGSVGRIATATINQLELATIDVDSVDADPRAEFLLSVVPTGSGISFWVASRFTDTNNYYYATLLITSGAVPELRLFKRVGGTGTQLGSTVTLNGPHVAGDRWVLQCSAIGSTIRARGWKSTQPTEQGWHITATDTALTTGTRAGVGVRRETGNTNGSTNVDIDPFEVPSLQTFTFDATPVNGVVKTITAGSPVSLAHPWRLAL
ncbi:carbohydrate binding domain-containing protein [Micromonosporaceae bacterium B7E4]